MLLYNVKNQMILAVKVTLCS